VENFRDLSERGLIVATIRKRGKGYQIDYCDPTGKRVRKSFKKKKDAQAELGKRVSLIAEGRYLDVKKEYSTTLGELLDKYVENFQHQASYKTGKKYHIEHIRNHFGEETLLSNIRYLNLETYRNHLKDSLTVNKTIRKDASINRAMSCLRHIFAKAVEWEMIEQSPFDKGKSLILKENNKRMRFLTEDEIKSLLDACNDSLIPIVECALNTGMRKGEILGLRWDQIRNGFIYLDKTKTNEARQIPVNDSLEMLFKRIRRKQHLTSRYVFTYRGKRVDSVKTAFNAAVRRAGIVDFRFHDLRHTFASQLLMKGGTLKDVQELLGHKTMTMTLRYAHLTQEHKRKAVNLLNGLTASNENGFCHKTVTFSNSPVPASP
jgi:integrase